MEVRRTVPVALDVDSDDAALLEDTVDTFLWSAQYVVDHAFEGEYVTTSKIQLDEGTYDDVREATDGFNGGLVQAARNKAAEACKSVVARWKNGKHASKPTFTSPHVVYDKRTATFHDDSVSLATTEGRIEADYILPDEDSNTPHSEYFFSDEYEITGAELHYRDSDWVLHVHCKKDVETDTSDQATTENGTVLGVDLGVNTLAVTSTGTFWAGDELDHWRREYEKRRTDLQQCGTRWVHQNIESVASEVEADSKRQLIENVADRTVKSEPTVTRYLEALSLPEIAHPLLQDGPAGTEQQWIALSNYNEDVRRYDGLSWAVGARLGRHADEIPERRVLEIAAQAVEYESPEQAREFVGLAIEEADTPIEQIHQQVNWDGHHDKYLQLPRVSMDVEPQRKRALMDYCRENCQPLADVIEEQLRGFITEL